MAPSASDRHHAEQDYIASPECRRLPEHELVQPAFVPARHILDHRKKADSHSEERGKHKAQGGIFLVPRGCAQELHRAGSQQTGNGRPNEDGERVFGHVPEKPERHARQHGVRQSVAQEGKLANNEKSAHQTATDSEQHRAGQRVPQRRVPETEEACGTVHESRIGQLINARGLDDLGNKPGQTNNPEG